LRQESAFMPSYRFCRPDDLELIVGAINQCCRIHETDTPEMTEERLKTHMTLFAVRPGNCMVALERHQPVAAVISTRREAEAWIQTLGCQPAFQRRGIASQLVEALVRKIAIQRTEDIAVDVPEDNEAALQFFRSVGFEERGRLVTLEGQPASPVGSSGETVQVPAADLLRNYDVFHAFPTCWERRADSLTGYGELLQGCAYRDDNGATLGYLLYRNATILDLACAPGADAARVSAILLSHLPAASPLTFPKVNTDDPLFDILQQRGLKPARSYRLMGQRLS
jgi:ribosomal protein S18 acetylase RimI-like enzyme